MDYNLVKTVYSSGYGHNITYCTNEKTVITIVLPTCRLATAHNTQITINTNNNNSQIKLNV